MAIVQTKNPMPSQAPEVRAHNFNEVALGYSEETAINEANRCLNCKNQPCVSGCPVNIHIPEFIAKVKEEGMKRPKLVEQEVALTHAETDYVKQIIKFK